MSDILALALSGSTIFSAGYDRTIKQWNAHTGLHLQTMRGHTRDVTTLCVEGEYLYSGSSYKLNTSWIKN